MPKARAVRLKYPLKPGVDGMGGAQARDYLEAARH